MNRLAHYILDEEHRPVEVDLMTWSHWFEEVTNRIVDWTQVTSEITVSTVFLGLDHRFVGNGPPLLFETMVFAKGHDFDEECQRYSSWDDALAGHRGAVRRVRAAIGQKIEPLAGK